MGIAENISSFYQGVVALLQEAPSIASDFLKYFAMVMICHDNNKVPIYEEIFRRSIEKDNFHVQNEDIIPEEKEIIEAFEKMREISRAGWIARNVPITHRENDAVHIMQMFALAVAYFKLDKSLDLDKKKVYEMIIIHEIGEVQVGDIREGTSVHDNKHNIERQAVKEIFGKIKRGNYFISLWDEFERRDSKEALFVYQLDKIDPILKAKILDSELERNDLFEDFFQYEERRNTFETGKVKELFYYSKEMEVKDKWKKS